MSSKDNKYPPAFTAFHPGYIPLLKDQQCRGLLSQRCRGAEGAEEIFNYCTTGHTGVVAVLTEKLIKRIILIT